jgi:hypothetical protein
LIAAEEAYGTETRLLYDVFGIVRIPDQPTGQVVGCVEMR